MMSPAIKPLLFVVKDNNALDIIAVTKNARLKKTAHMIGKLVLKAYVLIDAHL